MDYKPEGFDKLAEEVLEYTGPDEFTESLSSFLNLQYPEYTVSEDTLKLMYEEIFVSMESVKAWAINNGMWEAAIPNKMVHVLYDKDGKEIYAASFYITNEEEKEHAAQFMEKFNINNVEQATLCRTITHYEYSILLENNGEKYS